ncbi:MAG: phosphoribosyltransferase [Candidatus Bathyarchaeota archaeon]|jgi:hypoxanthine phosphoribosyltransferase|nr:phosphoribosyltransferase [Candidatus Bathyarchaeota archaeon]
MDSNLKLDNLHFLHLNWDDIQSLTETLAQKIIESGFKPDLIVAVSRGGFDPARILCDQLSVRKLASVQLEAYDGMVKRPEPIIVLPVNADVAGLKVLIADDVSDSGASLLKAKGHIEGKGASLVRVATLHIKPWSSFVPDYYAESVNAWVVYPWELKECLIEVADKLRAKGLQGKTIARELVEAGFKERDVAHYLPLE